MDATDLLLLAALRINPEQRLVHAHSCEPDANGHICMPESAFLRIARPGPYMAVKLAQFRRLNGAGLLRRTKAGEGEGPQDEYTLSPTAQRRFMSDPEWQRALRCLSDHFPEFAVA